MDDYEGDKTTEFGFGWCVGSIAGSEMISFAPQTKPPCTKYYFARIQDYVGYF